MTSFATRTGPLVEAEAGSVTDLLRRATAADGVAPLDEEARFALRRGRDVPHRHLLAPDGDGVMIGYAQVDPSAGTLAVVVDPAHRRRGTGTALLRAALGALPPGVTPSGWAHGSLPAAHALAVAHGLVATRELLQLRRDLTGPLPAVPLPEGLRLRPFARGQDDAAWLRLNAEAFADLPDQGGLTQSDLDARLDEPWADLEGFLLAEPDDGGDLAGFHWTKTHDRTEDDASPAGEVYVLGVAPGAQGRGLGAALLVAGLRHLRDRGLGRVLLYVDAANTSAVRLYRRLGFVTYRTDTLYAAPG